MKNSAFLIDKLDRSLTASKGVKGRKPALNFYHDGKTDLRAGWASGRSQTHTTCLQFLPVNDFSEYFVCTKVHQVASFFVYNSNLC